MKEFDEEVDVYAVNHLPIVKAYADKIGLVEIVNQLVPSEMEMEPGIIFLGMVLDTLSGRSPLYRLENFFENQDTELLLGKAVDSKSFNDTTVGRLADKLYKAGTIRIFTEISRRSNLIFRVECKHVHFDTTSRIMFGDYDFGKAQGLPFDITYGHSKDHRADLKQFLISMLCVERGIPIFGKPENGNESDKNVNNTVLTDISKWMANHGLEDGAFIYIADSAMVTKKNLNVIGDDLLFISRLPANYNECRRVIKESVEKDDWEDLGVIAHSKPTVNRPAAYYKAHESEVTLYGKKYRAVVIHSSAHDRRRQKRIERELKSERKALEDQSSKACKLTYFCRADAEAAAERLQKSDSEYYDLSVEVEERPKYERGRPRKDGSRKVKEMQYGLSVTIKEDTDAIATLQKEAGCFVMITNVPKDGESGYDACSILKAYKDQHGIERNFGFLKDPLIVNSIFLKKPERIEVLGLILLTALLIWRLIERSMRQYVEETGEKLTGWDNKLTESPTSFMMTTKFTGIMVIKIGKKRRLSKPLTAVQLDFLRAMKVKPEVFIHPRDG